MHDTIGAEKKLLGGVLRVIQLLARTQWYGLLCQEL